MSDTAFPHAPYPAYSAAELRAFIEQGRDSDGVMAREIERRERVANGDVESMTWGERLRHVSRNRAA